MRINIFYQSFDNYLTSCHGEFISIDGYRVSTGTRKPHSVQIYVSKGNEEVTRWWVPSARYIELRRGLIPVRQVCPLI